MQEINNITVNGKYVQPISIRLERNGWDERVKRGDEYFKSQGIHDVCWVFGVHADVMGIKASRPYVRDPQNIETGETVKQKTVGSFLSMYMILNVALSHPEWEYIMLLEDDCRFVDGWRDKLSRAIMDTPKDFDILAIGNCCTNGRERKHIKGDVYVVKFLCWHCVIVSRKALRTILETSQDASVPFDVSIFDNTLDKLKYFVIQPALALQENMNLPL